MKAMAQLGSTHCWSPESNRSHDGARVLERFLAPS